MRNKALPLFLPLALVVGGCATQRAPDDVAIERGVDIAGIDNGRGACIGGAQAEAADSCAFAIGVLEDEREQAVAVLSRKLIDYDDTGRPRWDIQDRLAVPRSDDLHLEQSSCRFDGGEDQTIVALVPSYDEHSPEWIRAQQWAYKVLLPSGRFQPLPPERVDCRNTAMGGD